MVTSDHCSSSRTLLYIYAVTGNNIWHDSHFEKILRDASCAFEGDRFTELNRLLSERLPVLEYAAMLMGQEGSLRL